MAMTRALAAVAALVVIVQLAESAVAAAMFVAFVAAFLFPALLVVSRAPHIRNLPDGLRLAASAVVVILLSAPWYFARKAIGMPIVVDGVTCVVLIGLAMKTLAGWPVGRLVGGTQNQPTNRPTDQPTNQPTLLFLAIPVAFSCAWLGYAVRVFRDVRFYGLFAIDFGNLVAVISSLRAARMLPKAFIVDGGPLNYHWLYFTLPATLADFLGLSMPNANALILTNLLVALLFVHTLVTVARSVWSAAIVLFAPFSVYAYQVVAARLELGWFELPARNHLLLSPVNSMIVFGNNTFALVLALFTIAMLERWNGEGKIGDALLGVIALAAILGYSITLVFPLAGALLVWTLLGRVRKPWLALPLAALAGAGAIALFRRIDILGSDSTRSIAVAFDGGSFLRMVLLGMIPLWGLLILRGRQKLTLHHVLIAVALIVPTVLMIEGSPTGNVDFSMKTASLIAVAFAPLIVIPSVPRRREIAILLVAFGVLHSAAYLLQYPWYRIVGHGPGESLPAGYYDALVWVRGHTYRNAVIIDPASVPVSNVLWPMVVAERRVWLPTQYTESALIAGSSKAIRLRVIDWQVSRRPRAEVAVLPIRCEMAAPWWITAQRFGTWSVCRRR